MAMKCPVCGRSFKTAAALKQHERDSHAGKKAPKAQQPRLRNRGPARVRGVAPDRATVVISQEEFLAEVAASADGKENLRTFTILPGKSGLSRLDQFGSMFEQWRLDSWVVHIVPKVGTMVSGSFIAGVYYEEKLQPTTKQEASVLSPKVKGAVWQERTLSVPPSLAQKQRWLFTSGVGVDPADSIAGQVVVVVDGTKDAKVDVWVSYRITFMGPTSHKRALDRVYRADGRAWKDADGKPISAIEPEEGPFTADFELSGDAAYVDQMVDFFSRSFRNWQQLQRFVSNGVTYVHGVLSALESLQLAAATATAGTILVLRRRPFRPGLPPASSSDTGRLSDGVGEGSEGGSTFDCLESDVECRAFPS